MPAEHMKPVIVNPTVADAFVAWEERQRTAAAARERAKGRPMSIKGDFDAATLSLMLWDLHCTISYAQASGWMMGGEEEARAH